MSTQSHCHRGDRRKEEEKSYESAEQYVHAESQDLNNEDYNQETEKLEGEENRLKELEEVDKQEEKNIQESAEQYAHAES